MDRNWFVTFLYMFNQLSSMNIPACKKISKLNSSVDYYNYYYGGYSQNPEASDTQEGLNTAAPLDAAGSNETTEATTEVTTSTEAAAAAAAAEVSDQPENSVAATTEVCFLSLMCLRRCDWKH